MATPSQIIPYNPSDSYQQAFLASLAAGETGSNSNAYQTGYGGANLAAGGYALNQYGFPSFSTTGPGGKSTSAAGAFQFEQGTWNTVAAQYGLNFQNPQDQNAGAWYEAQQVYSQKTGGQSLYSALQSGQSGSVQAALASTWPGGSQTVGQLYNTYAANPTALQSGPGSEVISAANTGTSVGSTVDSSGNYPVYDSQGQWIGESSVPGGMPTTGVPNGGGSNAGATNTVALTSGVESWFGSIIGGTFGSFFADIENWFTRGFLIVVGLALVIVALWYLLSRLDVVPSPTETLAAVAE